jgi:glycosyltransferase involved in cell wall biosynthesis
MQSRLCISIREGKGEVEMFARGMCFMCRRYCLINKKKMKIAQISPLYESVPPKFYGGTERVVHYLTEELVAQGHEVTLYASGDSITKASLIPCCEAALRLNGNAVDVLAPHFTMMERIEKEAHQYDVIHSHIDYLIYPFIKRNKYHILTTLHGRLDIPELQPLYKEYFQVPVVSISDSQRKPLPGANWKSTVYHGLPLDLYSYNAQAQDYLVFIGRISPEKRIDRAIEIAIKAGIPLRIAAKVDKVDKDYFETQIKKLIDHPLIEMYGEVGDREKQELLGNAMGLVFPVNWPEPFGLAMIEAMACGTPVIAYRCGSIPEVVDEGITGFVVNSQEEAVEAVGKLPQLSRRLVRQTFEKRFSAERMTHDYLKVYKSLIKQGDNNIPKIIQINPQNSVYGEKA